MISINFFLTSFLVKPYYDIRKPDCGSRTLSSQQVSIPIFQLHFLLLNTSRNLSVNAVVQALSSAGYNVASASQVTSG